MCRKLLFTEPEKNKCSGIEGADSPNKEWFELHHHTVREKYAGKFVIFLPKRIAAANDEPSVMFEEIDGVRILSSDSYKTLRSYVLGHPPVRAIMPIIVDIEG